MADFEIGELVEIVRPSVITKYGLLDREWEKIQIGIIIDTEGGAEINLVKLCVKQRIVWLPSHWLRKIEK
tara:strand:- start:1077 stop:1286 length:210 start_codon:yes stop_codon:yes gene_type:complete